MRRVGTSGNCSDLSKLVNFHYGNYRTARSRGPNRLSIRPWGGNRVKPYGNLSGKQRFTLRKMLKENPVSYLSHAKKLGSVRKIDDEADFGDGTNNALSFRTYHTHIPQQHDCQHCTDPSGYSFSQLSGCSLPSCAAGRMSGSYAIFHGTDGKPN
jgi:hypothetical protein